MAEFKGAYTALVTPFDRSINEVDLEALGRLICSQAEAGVRGVVPCGTTGESPVLSPEEHRLVVERTLDVAHPFGLEVIAGAGSNSTEQAVQMNRMVGGLGVDAALHVCPYYNRPSQEGLYAHFMAIADSAEHPIVLYDVPGRTGVRLAPSTVTRLADHPNIRALKAAGGSIDDVTEVLMGSDIVVLSGDDTLTLPMMSVGARGVISVVSNVMPAAVSALCTAVLEGRWSDAREHHLRIYTLAKALLELDANPVPVKTALELLGLCSGALRSPLVPPTPEVRDRLFVILQGAGIHPTREVLQA